MGIIDITKKLKEYNEADKEILDLADKLLKLEQNNVEECKNICIKIHPGGGNGYHGIAA